MRPRELSILRWIEDYMVEIFVISCLLAAGAGSLYNAYQIRLKSEEARDELHSPRYKHAASDHEGTLSLGR